MAATPGGPDAKRPKLGEATDAMEEDEQPALRPVRELMPAYYNRLFPHQLFYKWLAYGNDGKQPQVDASFFQRREFCFTMDGDIFVRYQSFRNGTELAEALCRKCPSKIDIGPVYTHNPQERKKFEGAFLPQERELVFDIDLTDYDDVRTCGKEGHICTKCWPLMAVAIQILDRGLREDFGFRNILFVYSGRRGIHCWVCDPSARKLTDEQRSAIASYFGVYKGNDADRIKVSLGMMHGNDRETMHPAIKAAYNLLEETWETLLVNQGLMMDDTIKENILKLIADDSTIQAIRRKLADSKRDKDVDINVQQWRELKACVEIAASTAASNRNFKLQRQLNKVVPEVVFGHSYPRLDVEVSRKMNHLLKAPFCVHPKTGKVCVPIDPAAAHEFDPDQVPTVQSLLAELPAKAPGKLTEEWVHTSLAPSMRVFQSDFLDSCLRINREQLAAAARGQAAIPSLAF